ncbi:MAG: hypothetical protein Q8P18_31750 [Pseudomonadota bacterium]|nr:hypothetical protein [Pseudomonadota bacterium]
MEAFLRTPLRFHATRLQFEDGPEGHASLSLDAEDGGPDAAVFSMTQEDPHGNEPYAGLVRLWWSDGRDGRDESVLRIASASIEPGRFELAFLDPSEDATGPYTHVDVTFDEVSPAELRGARRALAQLLAGLPPRWMGARRRTGPPVLDLVAARGNTWVVAAGEQVELRLTLTNRGGPMDGEVGFELEGAGVGFLDACTIAVGEQTASFAPTAEVPRATLRLHLDADLAIDRQITPGAPLTPSLDLAVRLVAGGTGEAWLAIRVFSVRARARRPGSYGRLLVVTSPTSEPQR